MVGVDKISKNEFLIDSHKLIYHPNEVSKWMNKEIIAPIYVEIGPINTCNHDCIFCGLDFEDHIHTPKVGEACEHSLRRSDGSPI